MIDGHEAVNGTSDVESYKMCSNNDTELILTICITRSKLSYVLSMKEVDSES